MEVSVKNFGPIAEGTVSLRPLTIFVGPNNSGKSYLSLLTYALSGGLDRTHLMFGEEEYKPPVDVIEWFRHVTARKAGQIHFADFPDPAKRYTELVVKKFTDRLGERFTKEIQRCFSSPISELVRSCAGNNFFLSQYQGKPDIHSSFTLRNNQLGLLTSEIKLSELTFRYYDFSIFPISFWDYIIPSNLIRQVFPNFFRESFYFPAARSGILQGHKVLAASVLSQIPLMRTEQTEVPNISGVVFDFISHLLQLERNVKSSGLALVAKFLETEVSRGTVDIEGKKGLESPEIYYKAGGEKVPLHRTSSMVSEMAPIILFLKYLVRKDSFLIIEEPEAHLHPDNQRKFAQAVVKLIRSGVQVLVTTHSDYFVQQISNFILLSQTPEERTKLGYSEQDYLNPDEVAAYLFRLDETEQASYIEEIEITAEEGISQSQFLKIAEAIYDETTRLQMQALVEK